MRKNLLAALVAIPVIAASVVAIAQNATGAAAVDDARLAAADREPGSWMAQGRTFDGQRFSPLTQINTSNVKSLGLAWYDDLDTERSQEATPVMVDGVLYISTAWSMVKAYDARTGAKLWEYDPQVVRTVGQVACCDVPNRGISVWKGRVYVGALDGRLIALDARTGKVVWSTDTADPAKQYTITGAPLIAKGLVIIGNAGAEYGVRGYVTAYDAVTGKQKWRFFLTPNPDLRPDGAASDKALAKYANSTWSDGAWKQSGGGGTVWDSMLYDPKLDLVYLGTGNGSPWNYQIRSGGKGDNLFLSSIVALKPDTGEYVWHYQTTPGDAWDYTATQPMVLADLRIDGAMRRVIMQPPKNAFFYILDAKTGQFLSAKAYAPQNWAAGIDQKTGRVNVNDSARYGVDKAGIVYPGPQGAHNWHPWSYNPQTGLAYLAVTEQVTAYEGTPPADFKLRDKAFNTGGMQTSDRITALYAQQGARQRGPGKSYLQAWDPVAGKEVWRAENTEHGASGSMSTAGGLVFFGGFAGDFQAFDARSGAKLWSFQTQSRALAAASTYRLGGEQYVAVLVGGRGPSPGQVRTSPSSANNSRLLVFKLGGDKHLPTQAVQGATVAALDPPLLTGSTEQVIEGERSYGRTCGGCHGAAAIADKAAPDLRYSPVLKNLAEWNNIVLAGSRVRNGMPNFSSLLAQGEAEDIFHYVISEANKAKAQETQRATVNPPRGLRP